MKSRKISTIVFVAAFLLLTSVISFAGEEHLPTVEKGYFGATVLLIDHETGDIGVRIEDDDTGKPMDMAFKVDMAIVEVLDLKNESMEFTDIKPGDNLNFYTETGKDAKERITEITDTSRSTPE